MNKKIQSITSAMVILMLVGIAVGYSYTNTGFRASWFATDDGTFNTSVNTYVTNKTVNPYSFNAANATGVLPNASIPATAMNYSATRFYINSFSRDLTTASGTQSITEVGFTPKYVQFYAAVGGTTQMSWGFDNGVTHKNTILTSAGVSSADGGNSIDILQPTGATSQVAYISSMDADGFTLTWTKAGSPTGNVDIIYTAYR